MYIEPKLNETRFTCPFCKVLAEQKWDTIDIVAIGEGKKYFDIENKTRLKKAENEKYYNDISISTCWNCKNYHVWLGYVMVFPKVSRVPVANKYMPENVKIIYNEAKEVYPKSYKASAALLRLALQHLCKNLGEEGKNINSDIGNLVKKGLPVEVQQALDIIRVTGNNSVHPGSIDFEDNKEVSLRLFELLNFIVERMIVEPKKINDMFNWLPERALKGIENRDNKK